MPGQPRGPGYGWELDSLGPPGMTGRKARAGLPITANRLAQYASLFILVLLVLVGARLYPRPGTLGYLLGPKTLALTLLDQGPAYNDFAADFIGARAF